jgi:hypothetical protein
VALADYITQVRRLLHDASGNYWTDSDLTDYINDARFVIAMESGSIRCLYNFYLSAGQESYPFQGALSSLSIAGGGSGYTSPPTVSFSGGGGSGSTATASITGDTVTGLTITANGTGYTSAPTISFSGGGGSGATASASIMLALDILNITVNWSNSWVTLKYAYFTEFQAKARFYRSSTGQPAIWSKGPPANTGGGDYFYIYQIPGSSYQCDIDAVTLPNVLIDDTTVEQLQYPFTDLVQYNAAGLAKFKQQQFEEAAGFSRMYDQMMKGYIASKFQRRVPNPYGGM